MEYSEVVKEKEITEEIDKLKKFKKKVENERKSKQYGSFISLAFTFLIFGGVLFYITFILKNMEASLAAFSGSSFFWIRFVAVLCIIFGGIILIALILKKYQFYHKDIKKDIEKEKKEKEEKKNLGSNIKIPSPEKNIK